jgi:thiamine-phosphate pyrophosphorylase
MGRRPLLYYITDRTQFPGDELARCRQLLEKLREAAKAGVDYIQLREKDLAPRELEELAGEAMRVICEQKNAVSENSRRGRLLINSRTDVALAVGADGVHLRSDDVSPAEVRKIAQAVLSRNSKPDTRDFVVAVSCHSEKEVRSAAEAGADFVVFAPVFEKRDASAVNPTGFEALAAAARHRIPVFALGGVTLENAHSCMKAGAAGIAGIRLFQQNVIAEVVHNLWRLRK